MTGLASIVRDHPKYAQEHQMAVIDCLEDPDETLKRKTLDLLYTMTNPVNVEFIAEKLLSFLEQGTDSFWRQVAYLCLFFSCDTAVMATIKEINLVFNQNLCIIKGDEGFFFESSQCCDLCLAGPRKEDNSMCRALCS